MNRLQVRNLFLRSAMLLGPLFPAAAAGERRETVNFNREWKFQLGDVSGAEAVAFNDAAWEGANLPHSFSEGENRCRNGI